MAWQGIWFEPLATDGGARSPEHFRGLVPPMVHPYVHGFVEEEGRRLAKTRDPSTFRRDGESLRVFYSLGHDGLQTGLEQQGCRIAGWLFSHFDVESRSTISSRFSEIPLVIHADDARLAGILGNAFVLLRFLAAAEDQAIAKILLHPWNPLRGSPRLAAEDYEKRVIDFLHGEIFYPEDVDLFDILERNDLKPHRDLPPCCLTQIGFIGPLLEWIDECWPKTPAERSELRSKIRNSLLDEARFARRRAPRPEVRKDAPGGRTGGRGSGRAGER